MNELIAISTTLIIYLLISNASSVIKCFKWLKVRKYVKIKLVKYIQLKNEQEKIIDDYIDDLQKKEFEMMLKANNIKKI